MIVEDRGLEYQVELKDGCDFYAALAKYISTYKKQATWGKRIIIASTTNTDERLMQSKYYADRHQTWFVDFKPGRNKKVINPDGMELTKAEQEYLTFVLSELGPDVVDHGWYDVCSLR